MKEKQVSLTPTPCAFQASQTEPEKPRFSKGTAVPRGWWEGQA